MKTLRNTRSSGFQCYSRLHLNRCHSRIPPRLQLTDLRYQKSRLNKNLGRHWRSLVPRYSSWKKFSKIIRLHNEISLELLSDDKPQTLIENIETKEKWPIEEFKVSIEKKHGTYIWNQKQLKNASLFHHEEEYYQLWDASAQHTLTQEDVINILSSKCYLDINLSENTATFTDGNQTLSLSGEAVKILYLYASTIQDQNPWVSTQEAYETWISHGGNPQSTMDRISWQRNKLCKRLEKENVQNSRKLFARKKEGQEWTHKLNLIPQNVTVTL